MVTVVVPADSSARATTRTAAVIRSVLLGASAIMLLHAACLLLATAPAMAQTTVIEKRCLVQIGDQPDDQNLEFIIMSKLTQERCVRGDALFLQYIPHSIPPLLLASALCDFGKQVLVREYPTHLFGHMTNVACVYAGRHRLDR